MQNRFANTSACPQSCPPKQRHKIAKPDCKNLPINIRGKLHQGAYPLIFRTKTPGPHTSPPRGYVRASNIRAPTRNTKNKKQETRIRGVSHFLAKPKNRTSIFHLSPLGFGVDKKRPPTWLVRGPQFLVRRGLWREPTRKFLRAHRGARWSPLTRTRSSPQATRTGNRSPEYPRACHASTRHLGRGRP